MIHRANPTLVSSYFGRKELLSSTLLKAYVDGYEVYQAVKKKLHEDVESELYYDEPKEHFTIGSAVDMILTYPEREFAKNYYVSTVSELPSDTEISIIKHVFDNRMKFIPAGQLSPVTLGRFLDHDSLISDAFDYHKYRTNYSFDAKKKVFDNSKISTYWNDLVSAAGRQIISLEDHVLINSLVSSFKNSPYTRFLFSDSENVDIFYQVPVYCTINNQECKILIDVVHVDHETQVITLYDIKTMQDHVLTFHQHARKMKYNIQSGFYFHVATATDKLKAVLQDYDIPGDVKNRIDRYHVNSFRFAVVSKSFPHSHAVVYTVNNEILSKIIDGVPQNYVTSIDTSGNFMIKTYQEELGIKKLMSYLRSSVSNDTEARYDNSFLLFQ